MMENDFYDEIYRRNRRERLVDYAIGGLGVIILFAVAMVIIPTIPVAIAESPVTIESVDVITNKPVCPGDFVIFENTISVNEPSIIGTWTAIMKDGDILNHTRETLEPVPRPAPVYIKERSHFKVPSLPPGKYTRIVAYAAINFDSKPAYILVNFTVSDDCQDYGQYGP